MAGDLGDQSLLSNKFGTISNKEVIFLSKKGLLGSKSVEEIPMHQIVAVRFYKQKSFVVAILGALGILTAFVIATLFSGSLILKIIGLVVLALGLWVAYIGIGGIPTVLITTGEGKTTQSSGWPNDRNEAKAFALVLREQIK
jgi:hypothetical protein